MRRKMLILTLSSIVVTGQAMQIAAARTALDRDLEGYVMASCLGQLNDAVLKEQGDAWATAIVQRSRGDFEPFGVLANAVKTELAKTGVGVVRRDGPVGGDLPVPVLTCGEIQDRPAVQRAIAATRAKLQRAYEPTK